MQIYSRSRLGNQPTDKARVVQQQIKSNAMEQDAMRNRDRNNINPFRSRPLPPLPPPPKPKDSDNRVTCNERRSLLSSMLSYTFKTNNEHLDYDNDENIYMVNNIFGGGTFKYKNDIQAMYPHKNMHEMQNREHLMKVRCGVNTILWIQQLLFTDIHPTDIVNLKLRTNCKIVISVHDFCWINYTYDNTQTEEEYHWNYLIQDIQVADEVKELFKLADLIIMPSWFVYNEYKKRFGGCNFVMVPHIDYKIDTTCKRVPEISDKTINIGVLHELNRYKGKEIVNYMMDNIKTYEGYTLNYMVAGQNIPIYLESEFNEFVKKYNIHCLLMMNRWGETYCYSLTKYINSGLPVFYNDIGAFRERISSDTPHYFKGVEYESDYDALFSSVRTKIQPFLDYVIEHQGDYKRHFLTTELRTNAFYNLFLGNSKTYDYSLVHEKVHPFAIYFPQYHNIRENDINYYKGMTDITNLNSYMKSKPDGEEALTPSLDLYGLTSITDYVLTDPALQQKQVDYAHEYGLKGFATYYYWFSTNSITNKNTIMEKGYENFFNGNVKLPDGFKLYFIWANEDWSNNPAFNSDALIKNDYTQEAFKKNVKNILQYFTHENYYKIDNKPVFYIHHPWVTNLNAIMHFRDMLNGACLQNGFDGVHLAVNNIVDRYGGFVEKSLSKYNHNPDYKKVPGTVDYLQHVKENLNVTPMQADVPQSLYFSFNNRPRLSMPNKLEHSTNITRSSLFNQQLNLQLALSHYIKPRSNVNKILLLNSWNEWGENMAIEPSNEKGVTYLNMIRIALLGLICNPPSNIPRPDGSQSTNAES